MNRYDNRSIIKNDSVKYKDYFEKRDVKFINQYNLTRLKYPTEEEFGKLSLYQHTWTVGDRYWKLAATYYNNPKLWWVLAWFNKKPTEGYVKAGDTIYIPVSLEQILTYLDI